MSHNHTIVTSVNLDYLSRAQILGESIKLYDKNIHFVVMLSEPFLDISMYDINEIYSNFNSIDEILLLSDLSLEINRAIAGLKVTEICTSVKAEVMKKILLRDQVNVVSYIDPDIMFFDSAERILNQFNDSFVLLTPHLLSEPIREWSVLNNEIAGSMRHGIFNLGFISCKKSKEAFAVLDWWNSRLLKYCREDSSNSIWTDQKWFDSAPVYFDGVKIVKEKTWNVATWNLDERRVASLNPPTLEDSQRLLFYHFSKAPSEGFKKSLKSSLHFNLVQQIADLYESKIHQWELHSACVEKMKLRRETPLIVVNEKNSRFYFLANALLKYPGLVKFVKSFPTLMRISRYVLRTSKNEVSTVGNTPDFLKDIDVEILYLSHFGGGGVEMFVKNYIDTSDRKVNIAIITPVANKKYHIEFSGKLYRKLDVGLNEVKQIINRSKNVHLHHAFGNEYLLDHLTTHPNLTVFLHDRYFFDQIPFSDTLKFESGLPRIAGISGVLNMDAKFLPENWKWMTSSLLSRSSLVLAPSEEILNEAITHSPSANVVLSPWDFSEGKPAFKFNMSHGTPETLNLVVLGAPGPHKGIQKVIQMADLMAEKNMGHVISLFGEVSALYLKEVRKRNNIIHYGKIEHYRVMKFLQEQRGNCLGWIPSLTRESFSFAFSDFVFSGNTFFATEHGALAHRGKHEPLCTLYNPQQDLRDTLDLMLKYVSSREESY